MANKTWCICGKIHIPSKRCQEILKAYEAGLARGEQDRAKTKVIALPGEKKA